VAPNLKAIERLAGAEAEYAEVSEEATTTRNDAKRINEEFQEIKQKRNKLFMKAYEHISGCIDNIYKDLTKSRTFEKGGNAFMSVEESEVGLYVWTCR
jgi:structural maintenance of chromosome 1